MVLAGENEFPSTADLVQDEYNREIGNYFKHKDETYTYYSTYESLLGLSILVVVMFTLILNNKNISLPHKQPEIV